MTTKRKWVKDVNTDSTHPREGLFKKAPSTIARELASPEVSPKGPASGMRMLNYYINRAGKNLGRADKEKLEEAKEMLSKKVKTAREQREKRSEK